MHDAPSHLTISTSFVEYRLGTLHAQFPLLVNDPRTCSSRGSRLQIGVLVGNTCYFSSSVTGLGPT